MFTPHVNLIEEMFSACADRTRLRILNLLADGRELCVCDIFAALNQPQAKISRHLAVLRSAGLVKQRVERHWRHYRLAEADNPFHQKLIACLQACSALVPELAADLECLSRGACCVPDEAAAGAPIQLSVSANTER